MKSLIPPNPPPAPEPAEIAQGVTRRSDTLPAGQNFPKARKPRSDSTLDSQLSPERADDLAHRLDHGLSLSAAAEHLREELGIQLSRVSISRWAARRRRARTALTFASLMQTVDRDRGRAAQLDGESPAGLHRANELFVSQALFTAFANQDPQAAREASRLFGNVLSTLSQTRRANACLMTAETRNRKLARRMAAAGAAPCGLDLPVDPWSSYPPAVTPVRP